MLYCPICGKGFLGKNRIAQVRISWLDGGGFGHVPLDARVHPRCDELEQARIRRGEIDLNDLWRPAGRKRLNIEILNERKGGDAKKE
jgi:hypothetical protein